MTILHMDVDACNASQESINAAREEIKTEATNLANTINQMVGYTWISPSGNKFLADFQGWNSQLLNNLETLAQLSAALGNEIAEWVSVGNSY